MSQQRNRIDPASREPLEGLLAAMPGGFNSIADIEQRRAVVGQLLPMMVSTHTAFGAVYGSETASLTTTNRKFKPQSTATQYALNPLSSSTPLS